MEQVTPLQKQYSGLWTMAEIINNRKILKRLREEIDSVVGTRLIQETDLPKLPYLQAIIKNL